MIQVLAAGKTLEIERAAGRPTAELWLSADALGELTGWRLEPEGLCKDEVCVPMSNSAREIRVVNGLFEPGTELEVEFVRGRELLRGRGRLCPMTARLWGE